jgi:two-component system sensor histidine kinase DesK
MSDRNCESAPAWKGGGARSALALGSIWLAFVVFPALSLARADVATAHLVLACIGVAGFVTVYIALLVTPLRRSGGIRTQTMSIVLIALATALTTLDRGDWASLFIYASATGALQLRPRAALADVLACTVLAAVLTAASGGGSSEVLSYTVSSAGIGFLLIMVRALRARNEELELARNDLAELAVTRERERFARDLHDLLGHSLSVISLKAQLARRLVASSPDEAATHLADIEDVTRDALREVRDAVNAYREPTLEDALASAAGALAAANIDVHFDVAQPSLTPQTEGVLAWAVREGTTNVIRHSHSRNCWIRVGGGDRVAAVEILDDGTAAPEHSSGGSGLRGLRDRAAALAGAVESGVRTEGGFRLAVTLPRATR